MGWKTRSLKSSSYHMCVGMCKKERAQGRERKGERAQGGEGEIDR